MVRSEYGEVFDQLPRVASPNNTGMSRPILVSAKETSRVTGTPITDNEIALELCGASPKKHAKEGLQDSTQGICN